MYPALLKRERAAPGPRFSVGAGLGSGTETLSALVWVCHGAHQLFNRCWCSPHSPSHSFLASHPSLGNGKTGRKSLPGSAPSHKRGRTCLKPICFVLVNDEKEGEKGEYCPFCPFANGLWHKTPLPSGTAALAWLGWAFAGGVLGALAPDGLCNCVILF